MPPSTLHNQTTLPPHTALVSPARETSLIPLSRCEFCDELADPRSSRFGWIYAGKVHSRIIFNQDGFVVMPTLGQLFMGSLLILPSEHFETMAQLPASRVKSLVALLTQIERRMQPLGRPVLFEHGAKCSTGSGCGIYHAHMH